ncbi:MAG: RHS repeat-associated core domain-containing protein [Verrucomicrobiota bacterium]
MAGSFSTGVDGVSINSTTNEVTIDPFAFKPSGSAFPGPSILEDNGKPHIAVTFTKTSDGSKETCKIPICLDNINLSFSAGDNNVINSQSNGANSPNPNQPNGGLAASTSNDDGDPISTATREFFFYQQLLNLNGPTTPVEFSLYHGSQLADLGFFNHLPRDFAGSHMPAARKIDFGGGGFFFQLQFHLGLGQFVSFTRLPPATDWTLSPGERWKYTVEETTDYYYLKDPGTQRVWIFKKHPIADSIVEPAYCMRMEDRNGNGLTYTLPADPTDEGPSSVTDGLGRSLNYTYAQVPGATVDARKFLTEVADHTGRKITFEYAELNGSIRLVKIVDPINGEYIFAYDANGFLIGKTMPEGNTPYTQIFETIPDLFFTGTIGAVTSQTNAFGEVFTFAQGDGIPGLGDKLVTVTYPDGSQRRHFHNDDNMLTALVDETGEVMAFTPDVPNDVFLGYTDRDGEKGTFTYRTDTGHVATMTDAKGSTTTYTYTESAPQSFQNPEIAESVQCTFLDLTRIDYADGTFREYTYDSAGNRLTAADRVGATVTATYNGRGQALTITNEESGVTTLTYDGSTALLDSVTDSDTGVTAFNYDSLSRLTLTTHPDANATSYTYDPLDRLETSTDEENIVTRYAYDGNSNLVSVTFAEGTPEQQNYVFDFDLLDRLVKITDPINSETTYLYDYHERPIQVIRPDTNSVDFEYDERRQVVAILDELDRKLEISRTPSELTEKLTSPEGRTVELMRDPLGRILKTTDASGDETETERDVFSRPTRFSDGLNRVSKVVYDGEGRITQREEPTVGTTTYDYDGNGRLTKLTDARNNEWDFGFTSMGRPQSIEDPQNHSETRTYDSRGRLHTITHPDGITETLAYFPDSQLQSRTFSDGLLQSFTFDPLNRLSQTTRQLGGQTETCVYTYDSRSNLASTTVNGNATSATYDTRNRLVTATYPGSFVVTYTYNARSEVTRVSDSLGNQIDFEYNADTQMSKCTKSNGRVTTYTYDAEGLIASISHDIGANINAVFNPADELASLTRTGFPADGSGSIGTSTATFIYNDNSEITNGGFTYDERGRPNNCTWDSDNRLISVNNGTLVSYRYDGLGQITSRTEGGSTTEYLYNAALASNPIVGEKTGSDFERFYVTLPNGEILYQIEDPAGSPSVRFHHHGQTGNVRFLTDATGAVTDSYAYDAYGRLLEKNGTNTQFYQYVGRLGVRTDAAASLIQMRHRYYDPENGRFLSRDPIFLSLMARNGLFANPYHYTAGAASYRTDPSGLEVGFDDMWEFSNDSSEDDDDYEGERSINLVQAGDPISSFPTFEDNDERNDYWDDDEDDEPRSISLVQAGDIAQQSSFPEIQNPEYKPIPNAFLNGEVTGNTSVKPKPPKRASTFAAAQTFTSQTFAIGLDGRLVKAEELPDPPPNLQDEADLAAFELLADTFSGGRRSERWREQKKQKVFDFIYQEYFQDK